MNLDCVEEFDHHPDVPALARGRAQTSLEPPQSQRRCIWTPLFRSGSLPRFAAAQGFIGEKIHIWPGPRILCFDGRLARSGRRSRGEP
jgi:hypothetical protein